MKWPRWREWLFIILGAAALSALIVPALKPRESGPPALCYNHLRQLVLALIQYGTDYDDRTPPRDYWMDATKPFVKRLLRCDLVKGNNLVGYALNASVKTLSPYDEKEATQPLVYDSVNLARNASDLGDSLPNPGRHHGGNFIAYANGQVRYVKTK